MTTFRQVLEGARDIPAEARRDLKLGVLPGDLSVHTALLMEVPLDDVPKLLSGLDRHVRLARGPGRNSSVEWRDGDGVTWRAWLWHAAPEEWRGASPGPFLFYRASDSEDVDQPKLFSSTAALEAYFDLLVGRAAEANEDMYQRLFLLSVAASRNRAYGEECAQGDDFAGQLALAGGMVPAGVPQAVALPPLLSYVPLDQVPRLLSGLEQPVRLARLLPFDSTWPSAAIVEWKGHDGAAWWGWLWYNHWNGSEEEGMMDDAAGAFLFYRISDAGVPERPRIFSSARAVAIHGALLAGMVADGSPAYEASLLPLVMQTEAKPAVADGDQPPGSCALGFELG